MDGSSSDPRSLIRGRNCIKVARMVVKLANKMIDHKLLLGTYWFSMYTIFFSIACLIYYFHLLIIIIMVKDLLCWDFI